MKGIIGGILAMLFAAPFVGAFFLDCTLHESSEAAGENVEIVFAADEQGNMSDTEYAFVS